MHGFLGYAGWQWMFVLEALPALVLGVVVLFFLTDRPAKAKWLTDQERARLENAMQDEQARAAKQSHSSAWRGLRIYASGAGAGLFRYLSRAVYAWHLVPANHSQFRCFLAGDWFLNAFPAVIGVIAMILWARHSDRTKSAAGIVAPACWRLPG